MNNVYHCRKKLRKKKMILVTRHLKILLLCCRKGNCMLGQIALYFNGLFLVKINVVKYINDLKISHLGSCYI